MKTNYLILAISSLLLLFGCNGWNNYYSELSEEDIIAIEAMEEDYKEAIKYNDSLFKCYVNQLSCDSILITHYDSLFHQFDSLFIIHHKQYSHNNKIDDHHHEGNHNIRHSWMMEHDEYDGHEYEHNMNSYELMIKLRDQHENVHP